VKSKTTTVGRLRIEFGDPDGPTGPDRAAGTGLRIERVAGRGPKPQRRIPVVAIIGAINAALLAFAGYVRSWAAIGAVSLAMMALLWLVIWLGRDQGATGSVEVLIADDELKGPDLSVALDQVSRVGVGEGGGSSHTVWVALSDPNPNRAGRSLLFDMLTEAEANAAASALREAIGSAISVSSS